MTHECVYSPILILIYIYIYIYIYMCSYMEYGETFNFKFDTWVRIFTHSTTCLSFIIIWFS
ncbi:hypothetical protein ACMBCM_09100, partial [Spiroplasma sp. K1]